MLRPVVLFGHLTKACCEPFGRIHFGAKQVLPKQYSSFTLNPGSPKSPATFFGNTSRCQWSKSLLLPTNPQSVPIRCFRTSRRVDALPAVIVLLLGRVAKAGAILFGRTTRVWWKKLPPEAKAEYMKRLKRRWYLFAGTFGVAAVGSYAYYGSHLKETPFTERKRFILFSDDQILAMGQEHLQLLLSEYRDRIMPPKKKSDAYERIVRVAQRLLAGNQDVPQIHDLEWTISVIDDDYTVNAFVNASGSIFVFTGMLKLCDSDDQLGVILGHEMAHAILSHEAEQASELHFWNLVCLFPLALLWAILPGDITAALAHGISALLAVLLKQLPYSRRLEEEADMVGLILASKACFDIRDAPVVWAKFALLDEFGSDINMEWMSTHPCHERRQAQLEELVPPSIEIRDICQCPALPSLDPRLKIKAYQSIPKEKQTEEDLLLRLKSDTKYEFENATYKL